MSDTPDTPRGTMRFFTAQGVLKYDAGDGSAPRTVRAVRARPISNPDGDIAILDEEHHEVMLLPDLAALDAESRTALLSSLRTGFFLPRILKVYKTESHYSNRYWDVETDAGRRQFVIKDPAVNVFWETNDRITIRDTSGNRYEIASLSALDHASRAEALKVI